MPVPQQPLHDLCAVASSRFGTACASRGRISSSGETATRRISRASLGRDRGPSTLPRPLRGSIGTSPATFCRGRNRRVKARLPEEHPLKRRDKSAAPSSAKPGLRACLLHLISFYRTAVAPLYYSVRKTDCRLRRVSSLHGGHHAVCGNVGSVLSSASNILRACQPIAI